MSHRGERAFDRIRPPQVLPVLGGEVVEGEQRIAILVRHDRLGVFRSVAFRKRREGGDGLVLRSAIQMSFSARLALPCRLFGSLLRTLAVLCTQQRCSRVVGHTSASAFQKPSAPSATASCGAVDRPRRLRSSKRSRQDSALFCSIGSFPTLAQDGTVRCSNGSATKLLIALFCARRQPPVRDVTATP